MCKNINIDYFYLHDEVVTSGSSVLKGRDAPLDFPTKQRSKSHKSGHVTSRQVTLRHVTSKRRHWLGDVARGIPTVVEVRQGMVEAPIFI